MRAGNPAGGRGSGRIVRVTKQLQPRLNYSPRRHGVTEENWGKTKSKAKTKSKPENSREHRESSGTNGNEKTGFQTLVIQRFTEESLTSRAMIALWRAPGTT